MPPFGRLYRLRHRILYRRIWKRAFVTRLVRFVQFVGREVGSVGGAGEEKERERERRRA